MGGNRWPFSYHTGLNPRNKWTVKLIHKLTQIQEEKLRFSARFFSLAFTITDSSRSEKLIKTLAAWHKTRT